MIDVCNWSFGGLIVVLAGCTGMSTHGVDQQSNLLPNEVPSSAMHDPEAIRKLIGEIVDYTNGISAYCPEFSLRQVFFSYKRLRALCDELSATAAASSDLSSFTFQEIEKTMSSGNGTPLLYEAALWLLRGSLREHGKIVARLFERSGVTAEAFYWKLLASEPSLILKVPNIHVSAIEKLNRIDDGELMWGKSSYSYIFEVLKRCERSEVVDALIDLGARGIDESRVNEALSSLTLWPKGGLRSADWQSWWSRRRDLPFAQMLNESIAAFLEIRPGDAAFEMCCLRVSSRTYENTGVILDVNWKLEGGRVRVSIPSFTENVGRAEHLQESLRKLWKDCGYADKDRSEWVKLGLDMSASILSEGWKAERQVKAMALRNHLVFTRSPVCQGLSFSDAIQSDAFTIDPERAIQLASWWYESGSKCVWDDKLSEYYLP